MQPKNIYASVLVLSVETGNGESILFTKRSLIVDSHKGQVSFPGGMNEPIDINPLATAIRETREEIGVCEAEIEITGSANPVHSRNQDFLIYPFKGRILKNINFKLNQEVDKIIFVPVKWLKNPLNAFQEIVIDEKGNAKTILKFEPYQDEVIWGITAAIVMQVL